MALVLMDVTGALRCSWLGVGPSLSLLSSGTCSSLGGQSDGGGLHASLGSRANGRGEGWDGEDAMGRGQAVGGIMEQILRETGGAGGP